MKIAIAATFSEANQNSNSPYVRTDNRLVAVIATISTSPISQTGAATQCCSSVAPAIVSTPTVITQKYQ